MAKLIETLALAGSRKSDGTPNASGKVWVYILGTSTLAAVYEDRTADTAATQPVILDAAGKATLYVDQTVTLHIETSTGATLDDIDFQDAATVVSVENEGFTGTLEDGSQGGGGETDLDAVLTSAFASFGGLDFKYKESSGATGLNVKDWMSGVWVSVLTQGARGNGTVDDTTAIQAAANRVLALGGGVVYFPPGTYLISAPITVTSGTSVSFRGAGAASIIKNSHATANAFTFTSCTDYSIEQLKVSHSSSSTGIGISVVSCTNTTLRGVTISSGHAKQVSITGSSSKTRILECSITLTTGIASIGVYYSAGSYHTIANCAIVPTSGGKLVSYDGATSYCSISNTFFTQTGQGAVVFEATLTGTFFNVSDCPSLSQFAGALSPAFVISVATIPVIKNWGCGLEQQGSLINILSGATSTPVFGQSFSWRLSGTTTGAAYQIANPNPALHASMAGQIVYFLLGNAAGGAVTGWTFDTLYKTSAATDTTNNKTSAIAFWWDGTVFRELSRASSTTV